MSGLTFYETLRILVPGSIAVFILDAVLRLGFGASPVAADGGAQSVVSALELPIVSVVAALVAGLMLYLMDLPSKTRIFSEGDPVRNRRIPSQTLGQYLAGTPMGEYPKNLSLYFLLSDRYLPPEFHRRVYLFGSLYRVYVDLRVLTASALVAGIAIACGFAATKARFDPMPAFNADNLGAIVVILVAILLAGVPGVASYGVNVAAKHGSKEFPKRLRREMGEIWLVAFIIFSLGGVGGVAIIWGTAFSPFMGLILALMQLVMWTWIEFGPPNAPDKRTDIRSITLRVVKADRNDVQYGPLQRLTCDVALLLPWLLVGSVLYANLGSNPMSIGYWGALAVPSTLIMSLRKHEVRLLASYESQSTWLDMHAQEIANLRQTGRLPDQWR